MKAFPDSGVILSRATTGAYVLLAVLACLIPGLWWTYADRPFAFRWDLMLTMTGFVMLAGVALLAGISRGFRHRLRWSIGVTAVAVVVLFQWSSLTAVSRFLADRAGISLLAELLPVAIAGAFLWLAVRLADELAFVVIVGLALVAAVAVLSVTAFGLVAPAPEAGAGDGAIDNPPVLLLVLDGYGRGDYLLNEFGYDNSEFLAQLEDRGFVVAPEATANYGFTYASVSTMLNLDYVFEPGPIRDDQFEVMRGVLTGASGLMARMRDAGYSVSYIENAWGGSQCGSGVDRCVRTGLTRRAAWNLGQMTIFAPLLKNVFRDPFNSLSFEHMKDLPELLVEDSDRTDEPTFFFAHILLPHSPMLLNSDCSIEMPNEFTRWGGPGGTPEGRSARYNGQVECLNRLVVDALDSYLGAHPDAIVMITADHGPGSRLVDADLLTSVSPILLAERYPILSAYRLPGCSGQPDASTTPVNGARLVANCAIGTQLPLLPDRNYWLGLDGKGSVRDVTDDVRP